MNSTIIGGRELPESVYRRDVGARTAGAISASKGGYAIADTSTTAKVGDLYRAETATTAIMVGKEYLVIEASTNSFTIASKDLPVLGDTFFILAPTTLRIASDGSLSATISGSATEAKQDTMITSLQLLDDAVSTTGAAVPAKGFQVTGTDGTNARALKTDSSGELQIDVLSSALPSGASTSAKQDTLQTAIDAIKVSVEILDNTVSGSEQQVDIVGSLPAGTAVIGKVSIDQTTPGTTNLVALAANQSVNVAQANGVTILMGAGSTGTGAIRTTNASGATPTVTAVADSASSVTLLAADTARLGASFFNDSTSILYLKFGATASTSSYTVQIASLGFFELPGPNIYNGIIDGIWSANTSGSVLVTSW